MSRIRTNTNDLAPVKCKKTITINADRKRIWSILAAINNWPLWQKDISFSKLNGELKPGTTFDWKSGGVTIHSTLHTVESFNEIGWTGKALGTFAIHNWKLIEKSDRTEVIADESMEGFLVRLLKKMFRKNLEKGMQSWLEMLKEESEK